MKARDYCCCAIPVVNPGIYSILIEQMSLGVLVGTLSIATPSIVGAATPSFAPWILGIIAYVAAGVQIIGFIGVSREKPTLYRRYVTLHGIITAVGFSVAAVWAIISATRHSAAKSKCIEDFFTSADGTSASEGDKLCTIFPWVDVGIMGGLWVILAILHAYFFVVISSYGKSQRRDHDQYDRTYDPTQPLTENIPLQNDPWDSRQSNDYQDKPDYPDRRDHRHGRQASAMSASDILGEQYQHEPKDSFAQHYSMANEPDYPSYAHTPASVPTPTANYYQTNYSSNNDLERPTHTQPHPGASHFKV